MKNTSSLITGHFLEEHRATFELELIYKSITLQALTNLTEKQTSYLHVLVLSSEFDLKQVKLRNRNDGGIFPVLPNNLNR